MVKLERNFESEELVHTQPCLLTALLSNSGQAMDNQIDYDVEYVNDENHHHIPPEQSTDRDFLTLLRLRRFMNTFNHLKIIKV